MYRTALIFLFASFSYLPVSISAAEMFVGASITRANLDGDFINPQQSENEVFLSLSLKLMDRYWGDSGWGYYLAFDMDSYKTNRSDVIGLGPTVTINTSISGNYLYATPTIFYNFTRSVPSDWSVKVGLGLGVGYLSMDGTIMVNTPPGPRVEQFDGSDLSYSTGIIIRYEYKDMIIQVKEFTPFATIDGIEMELQLPVFTVGYKYSF